MDPSKRGEFLEATAYLQQYPAVHDCAVLPRTAVDGSKIAVAYVVADATFSGAEASRRLSTQLPPELVPREFVLVSAIPYGDNGEVDDAALSRVPVVNDTILTEWENNLQASEGAQGVAILLEPNRPQVSRIHLADILPDREAAQPPSVRVPTPSIARNAAGSIGSVKPAISHAANLRNAGTVPRTLQQALLRGAKTARGIRYIDENANEVKRQTYAELLDESCRLLAGLRALGLKPKDYVILQLDRNEDFIPVFWACVLGGFVPAPISIAPTYAEANATVQKLQFSWEMLDQPVVVAGDSLAPEIRAAGAMLGLRGFRVADVGGLRRNESDRDWHDSDPNDVCLILLTSGSTGQPKGVQQRHCSILTRSAGTAEMNGYDGRDISLNWFPLDHVGGIVMFHMMDLYACNEQIHVPTNAILQDPLLWLDLIQRYRATITWAPNFAFGLINDHEQDLRSRTWDLSSMRFILNGGEAIVAKTVRRFMELLAPHGLRPDAMHPAWGMSETCSGVAFSNSCSRDTISDEDAFVEVGAPIPGASFRIVDGSDRPVSEGDSGRLQVKGEMVTIGYYKNDALNRESFSVDGWFNTGDLAVLRDGKLTITGRAKDVIIINGVNFYSHEIEAIVEEVPGVDISFTAAMATRTKGTDTDKVLIFFHPLSDRWDERVRQMRDIRTHLMQKMGIHADYLLPIPRESIPKTAIGKIQRSQLRAQFENGEFNTLMKEVDLREGNSRTLPAWFHQVVWHARRPKIRDGVRGGKYAVFASPYHAAAIARALGRECQCAIVEPGTAYEQLGPLHFRIDIHDAQQYSALLAQCGPVTGIIHAWNLREPAACTIPQIREAQFLSAYSLLFLAKALQDAIEPIDLLVLTRGAQRVENDDVLSPEQASVIGAVKTISLEIPLLRARHVDVDKESEDTGLGFVIAQELSAIGDAEVAYRRNRRFVSGLASIEVSPAAGEAAIVPGGLYLITGGLGGIGTAVSKLLVDGYQAKLLIVGTTVLPDRESWNDVSPAEGKTFARIRNMIAIEEAGGDVVYRALDVCDEAALRAAVACAETRFGRRLDGIFHLAGEGGNLDRHWQSADTHYLHNEKTETFESMFAPKAYGAVALASLVRERTHVLFVAFSSVNSLFGGATFGAYSAANSLLDALMLKTAGERAGHTLTIDWTMWQETGMSANGPAFAVQGSERLGYCILPSRDALTSLLIALQQKLARVAVGLDANSPYIRRYLHDETRPLFAPVAYVAGDRPFTPQCKDKLGNEIEIERIPCPWMPIRPDGAVDKARLLEELHREDRGLELIAPRNEVEKQLAQIWCEVLRLPRVGTTQKLFELGGDSLTAVRLVNRVCETFAIEMPLRALFQSPTVAELAAKITEIKAAQRQRKPAAAVSVIDQQTASAMLENLDQLTDEQVDAALEQLAREQAAGQ